MESLFSMASSIFFIIYNKIQTFAVEYPNGAILIFLMLTIIIIAYLLLPLEED